MERDIEKILGILKGIDYARVEIKELGKAKELYIETKDGSEFVANLSKENPQLVKLENNLTSIISFLVRGQGGDPRYRGNCSPRVYEKLLKYLAKQGDIICDAMEGSGTLRDVANKLGYKYYGYDLKKGFNALNMELPVAPNIIGWHPPYYVPEGSNMPIYNPNNPSDGSTIKDYREFLEWRNQIYKNFYSALKEKGYMIIIDGDTRCKGKYYSPWHDMNKLGEIKNIIIKEQHNCCSDNIKYSGKFIPIVHEYVAVIQKPYIFKVPVRIVKFAECDLLQSTKVTWKTLIQATLESLGGKSTRENLYTILSKHPKAQSNNHVAEKIRQIINTFNEVFIKQGDYIVLA